MKRIRALKIDVGRGPCTLLGRWRFGTLPDTTTKTPNKIDTSQVEFTHYAQLGIRKMASGREEQAGFLSLP